MRVPMLQPIIRTILVITSVLLPLSNAFAATNYDRQAAVLNTVWYDTHVYCGNDTGVATAAVPPGSANAGGAIVAASYYGGGYDASSGWYKSNNDQGGRTPYDDNGVGTDGKPLGTPKETGASFAELSMGTALGHLKGRDSTPGDKIAITYKGKTIIAEKRDIGSGGPGMADPNDKNNPPKVYPRAIDLWWEAAKLLNFTDGSGLVSWHKVDAATPVTPLGGTPSAVPASNGSSDSCCATPGDIGTASGNDNVGTAFKFFISQGLSPQAAAGIVGNLKEESGVNPNSHQYGGGVGRGIAQWSFGGRWDSSQPMNLVKFAGTKSKSPTDLMLQLNFVWYELNNGFHHVLTALKKPGISIKEATLIFEADYEIAGTPHNNVRLDQAQKIFNKYGGSAAAAGPPSGGSVGTNDAQCSTGGVGNVGPDGYVFPVEPQLKSKNSHVAGLSALPCPSASCHHDGTAAFDIGRQPGSDSSTGAAEYAIRGGTIENSHIYAGQSGCYSFHIKADDGWDYYYTHTRSPIFIGLGKGPHVTAGQKVAEIGRRACTGNSSLPHLHIDRGWPKGDPGGIACNPPGRPCRDRDFTPLMNKIFNALPN
ncbi:MAG: peptidase [Patescibacteria group bacterium]|nr:peptidase [Patescibacteria group bacterium]